MESIKTRLRNGGFVTSPGDVFTIYQEPGILSADIRLRLENGNTRIDFSIENRTESWEWLKTLNEIGGRKVLFKFGEADPVPFEKSAPYIFRFGGCDEKN